MIFFVALVFSLVGLVLEGAFVSLPLFLLILLSFLVVYQTSAVFVLSFFFGFVIDSMFFRPLGQTSVYLVGFLLLVAIYERKFETRTYSFMLFSTLIGSFGYLLFFGFVNLPLQLFCSVVIAVTIFTLFVSLHKASRLTLPKE